MEGKDAIRQELANKITTEILSISETHPDFTIEDFEYLLNAVTISIREQIVRRLT